MIIMMLDERFCREM